MNAGYPGLHLQLITWGNGPYATFNYRGIGGTEETTPLAEYLGFDSMTYYQWVSVVPFGRDYAEALPDVQKHTAALAVLEEKTAKLKQRKDEAKAHQRNVRFGKKK